MGIGKVNQTSTMGSDRTRANVIFIAAIVPLQVAGEAWKKDTCIENPQVIVFL
jgi:hypothetical protein